MEVTTTQSKTTNKTMRGCAVALGCLVGAAWSQVAAAPKAAPKKAVLRVTGKVKAVAKAPRPGSVPYKDAVIAVHMTSVKAVQGKLAAKQILVYTWGMKNNKATAAASYRPGQTLTLRLTPWDKVERKYGSYNRAEINSSAVDDLDAYWGEN